MLSALSAFYPKRLAYKLIAQLQEHMGAVLAQGLRFVSPDELDALTQEFSALNLVQPAALLTQIQQHIASGNVEPKDAESFIKAQQILAQAQIRLSDAGNLHIENLSAAQSYHGVAICHDEIVSAAQNKLDDIVNIPNPVVRNHVIVEYLKQASYDELVQSIDIIWYDYSLSNAIVAGLQDRPEEALKLARMALGYKKNAVMQRTGLKVLEMVGLKANCRSTVTEILATLLIKKAKEPLSYVIKETQAKIEDTYPAYRIAQQKCINEHAHSIRQLSAPKKSDRLKAIRALAKTKNPCFTKVVMQALEDLARDVVNAAIKALVKIGGFAAIPHLAYLLEQDPSVTVFSHAAAEALYAFGDRQGLEYFLRRKLRFPLEAYVQIADFGELAFHPLLRLLKGFENPTQYSEGFASLFRLLRSEQFARKILEYVRKDDQLGEQLLAILQAAYPAQSQKILKAAPEKHTAVQTLVTAMLGENPHKLVAHLRHKALIHNLCVAPDRNVMAVLDALGNVTIWKIGTWKKVTSFPLKTTRQHYYIHQIAFTPEGEYLIVTNNLDNAVDILKAGEWKNCLASLKHNTGVYSVATTEDGRYVLGGGRETVKIWEFGTWQEVAELTGHSNGIEVIQVVPGKSYLLTGDRNGVIQVWNTTAWKKIADLKVNNIIANSVAISPDGSFVIAVETLARYLETTVIVWETEAWEKSSSFVIPSRIPVTSFAFTPDGKYLLTGADEIRFLKVRTWEEVLKLTNNDTRALTVTPDSKYVVAGANVWRVDWSLMD